MLFYIIHVQYCAKVMRTNFDEFRQKVSKTFENERYFEPNEFSSKFRCFFETAIVLSFAKNRANPRKVRRNFKRHFADSIEFSQLNSKRASKFRRLFRKGLNTRENTLFMKAQFVIKITIMCPVFLASVSRVRLYF